MLPVMHQVAKYPMSTGPFSTNVPSCLNKAVRNIYVNVTYVWTTERHHFNCLIKPAVVTYSMSEKVLLKSSFCPVCLSVCLCIWTLGLQERRPSGCSGIQWRTRQRRPRRRPRAWPRPLLSRRNPSSTSDGTAREELYRWLELDTMPFGSSGSSRPEWRFLGSRRSLFILLFFLLCSQTFIFVHSLCLLSQHIAFFETFRFWPAAPFLML